MVTPADRQALLARLRQLPDAAEAAVRGLSEVQLDTPCAEGEWTARQVVHHLADAHMNGFIRMKLILTEEQPTLKPYDQDEWVKLRDSAEHPVRAALSILAGLHERWSALLESLPESSWRRSATHPETGTLTLDDLLVTYARHGETHVRQITGLRTAKGW
jgi:hypothetical protein